MKRAEHRTCSVEKIEILKGTRKIRKLSVSLSAMKWGRGPGRGGAPGTGDEVFYKAHSTSNIQHPTSNEAWAADWMLHDGGNGREKFDLEERLLEFAGAVIDLSEKLPNTRAGNHIAGQILRSGTSPYPNHGEAEDAESREDFIHKLNLCLKELRETRRWARLVSRNSWAKNDPALSFVLKESDELIRIFFSSIQTAKRNLLAANRKSQKTIRYPITEAG